MVGGYLIEFSNVSQLPQVYFVEINTVTFKQNTSFLQDDRMPIKINVGHFPTEVFNFYH